MTTVFCYLLLACSSEPEYDLSAVPIQEPIAAEKSKERPNTNRPTEAASQAEPGEGEPVEELEAIANNDCAPPPDQKEPLSKDNSVALTVSLDVKAAGYEVMIDLIESSFGELKYGLVCSGTNPTLRVPKMLGTVRVAAFVDADINGPSKNDLQGMSKPITITDQDVSIPTITWSDTPIEFYNFDAQDEQTDQNATKPGEEQ